MWTGTVDIIVAHYLAGKAERLAETQWWRAADATLAKAIERAALGELHDGRVHPHQRRLGRVVLRQCAAALSGSAFNVEKAASFHDIHCIISDRLRALPRVGELAIYDIADRISLHCDLEPTLVYLHAGARVGARRILGRLPRNEAWSAFKHEFPKGFQALTERELEDVLCTYKDHFHLPPEEATKALVVERLSCCGPQGRPPQGC